MFRRTFARKYLIDCGGNASTLQKLLGHSTLEMMKYSCAIFNADVSKGFDNISPLNQLSASKSKAIIDTLYTLIVLYNDGDESLSVENALKSRKYWSLPLLGSFSRAAHGSGVPTANVTVLCSVSRLKNKRAEQLAPPVCFAV